jgi:hypothetical protein
MGTLPQQEGLPPLRSPGCDNQVGGPNPFLQRVGKGGRGVGDRRTNQPPFAIAVGKGGWEAQRQRGGGPQATRGTRQSNTGNHTRQASKGGRGYPEPLAVYAGSESVVSRYPKRPFRDQGPRHAREHPPNGTGIPARNFFTGQPNKQATSSNQISQHMEGRLGQKSEGTGYQRARPETRRMAENNRVQTSADQRDQTAPGRWGSRDVGGRGCDL